jgi:plasmid stability protein
MNGKKDRKSIHAKLDEDLHKTVRIEAARKDVSVAELTRQALRAFVVECHEEGGGTCVPDKRRKTDKEDRGENSRG